MWDFVLYQMPWQVTALIVLVVWAAIAILVGSLFGWKYGRMILWPALIIGTAIAFILRARQAGYADRKAEEQGAVDKAVDDFKQHEADVDKKPIDQIDKENSKWLRP
jgi:uncharacterized membrane protein YdjX (TVP38/TMEM64 family)